MASAPPETGASGAAEAAKQRGNAEFKSGNYRSAVREYTEAIEQEPAAAAVLLLNRAAALMALGEYQRALADCRQSRKAYGDAAPLAPVSGGALAMLVAGKREERRRECHVERRPARC